jgi:tetratricopeptide (TPR) repeat protein
MPELDEPIPCSVSDQELTLAGVVQPPRTLNVRFLAVLLVTAALFVLGVVRLHAFQLKRTAVAFRVQSDREYARGDSKNAIARLNQYLSLVPDDIDARLTLGLRLQESAKSRRESLKALWVLERVLREDPQRHGVRRRVVNLSIEVERYSDALWHLEALLESMPEDGELEFLAATCHEARGNYARAAEFYRRAYTRDPGRVESYYRHAILLRRMEQPHEADSLIETMVQANDESYRAYLAQWRYHKEFALHDSIEEQDREIARLIELAPNDLDVLIEAIELALSRNDERLAREHLGKGIELYPKTPRLYQLLAKLELGQGRSDAAAEALRKGLGELSGNNDLLLTLARLQIERGEPDSARQLLGLLLNAGFPSAAADCVEASILVHEKKWIEASRLLERARGQSIIQASPDYAALADRLLAQCYGELGDTDRQIATYRHLVSLDPDDVASRLALASLLVASDRVEHALVEYRTIAQPEDASTESLLQFARALVLHNLRLPEVQRDWPEVDDVLARVSKSEPDSIELLLLRAESLFGQGKRDKARQELEEARMRQLDRAELWIACANLAESLDDFARAEATLNDAVQQLGDRVDLRLASASFWARRGGERAGARLLELEEMPPEFSAGDRSRLLRGLMVEHFRLGNVADVERLLSQLAQLRPFDLLVRQQMFDLAAQSADDARMQQLLREIEHIEGKGGTLAAYGQAVRLLVVAKRDGDQRSLSQAHAALRDLASRRPAWRAVSRALGEVEELAGNPSFAIDHYQRAIDLGDRDLTVIRRLVHLLFTRRRFLEVDQLLRKIEQATPITAELQRLGGAASLHIQDPSRAIELAHKAASAEPQDHKNQLWLGLVLWSSGGNHEQAELALRRAVQLADQVPATWVTLVRFLASTAQRQQAEAVMEQMRQRLPQPQADFALAQCNEAIGRMELAEAQFAQLAEAEPSNLLTLRTVAEFHLRHRPERAEPYLRNLLKRDPTHDQVAWARRALANLLVTNADYQSFLEAIELVQMNLASDPNSLEDQRSYALLLATRAHSRKDAIRMLEDLADRQVTSASDQFVLAQLCEASGDWPKARQWLSLLVLQGKNPAHLAVYTRSLIEHGETREAQIWLAKLEGIEPKSNRCYELKARLLVAQGHVDEGIRLLTAFLAGQDGDPKRRAARSANVALLLDELAQSAQRSDHIDASDTLYREAEELYRENTAHQPENAARLALFLARRDRVDEALDLVTQAPFPAHIVGAASIAVIRSAGARHEHCQRVEQWLEAALNQHPGSQVLFGCLAELRMLQGRLHEAITLNRQILQQDSANVVALNNLAWLLAVKDGNGTQALRLVNRAIEILGPAPELLDTRATAYLASGEFDKAIEDLREAIGQEPAASKYLHLAQAYMVAKNSNDAQMAWKKMKAMGVDVKSLSPSDRATYERISAQLSQESELAAPEPEVPIGPAGPTPRQSNQ